MRPCTDCRFEALGYCFHPRNLSPADGKPIDCCRAERIGVLFAVLFGQCGAPGFFFEPKAPASLPRAEEG